MWMYNLPSMRRTRDARRRGAGTARGGRGAAARRGRRGGSACHSHRVGTGEAVYYTSRQGTDGSNDNAGRVGGDLSSASALVTRVHWQIAQDAGSRPGGQATPADGA